MLAIVAKSLKRAQAQLRMCNACDGALHLPVPYGQHAAWRVSCRGQLATVWAEGCSCARPHHAALENSCAAQGRVLHNVDAGIVLSVAPCTPTLIKPGERALPVVMRQATLS